MDQYEIIGRSIDRLDIGEKVLGKTKYAADLAMPNMLYAKALFSQYPHARVLSIDTRKAEKMDGVVTVLTHKDVNGPGKFGVYTPDQPVLIPEGDKCRFQGDVLALVAAESARVAQRAVKLIEVKYEVLPPLCNPREALAPGAPLVHEDRDSNVLRSTQLIKGDVALGLQQAHTVVEHTYFTPRQEHAYLETEAALAFLDEAGIINIFTCTQDPYDVLVQTARALDIPMNRLRVVATPLGGAFGGKSDVTLQVLVALLTMRTKRPAKMVFTREESFFAGPKRHPIEIRIKLGADKGGRLLAMDAEVLSDVGAYATQSPGVISACTKALSYLYSIPHMRIISKAVYTNNPLSSAMAGFGSPQAAIARETVIDMLAKELGLSPIEIRLKNLLREDEKPASPHIILNKPDILREMVHKAQDMAGELPKSTNPRLKTGRGICFDMPSFEMACIQEAGLAGVGVGIEMFPDASLTVYATVTEMGTGQSTVLTQLAAEELGLRPEDVYPKISDTAIPPRYGPSVGSRQTFASGNALLLAAGKLKERILERAGQELEISPHDLIIKDRIIFPKAYPSKSIPLRRVAELCYEEGINLCEQGWYRGDNGSGGNCYMVTIADVEADPSTGDVHVLNLIHVHDIGKALNPKQVMGAMYGSGVMGIGYALSENIVAKNGCVQVPSFTEYLIPTALDIPKKHLGAYVEYPFPYGPFGAKAIGDHAIRSTTPAIINAIHDALSIRVSELPITPERIFQTLREKEHGSKQEDKDTDQR